MATSDDQSPGRGKSKSKVPRPDRARSVAQEAFLFGAPLVNTSLQADYLAQVTEPTGLRAPLNQFGHGREFVDASDRTVVGFNVDNLYSFAVLDLSEEPVVMTVPEMGDRYWVMQVIDGWNGVPAAPGSRTCGGRGGTFVITGPGQDIDVPDGMEELHCPTRIAMIGGRDVLQRSGRLRRSPSPDGPVHADTALSMGWGLRTAESCTAEARRGRRDARRRSIQGAQRGTVLQQAHGAPA